MPLQQHGVTRHALGRLRRAFEETRIKSEGLAFVARIRGAIEEQTEIGSRAVELAQPRVQIAERLQRFEMIGHRVEHRLVGLDGVTELVLLEIALGAVELLLDIYCHPEALKMLRGI